MSQPLAGVRVLEIANILAGPFASMLLADMGADVIKLEALKGDMARAFPPLVNGESPRLIEPRIRVGRAADDQVPHELDLPFALVERYGSVSDDTGSLGYRQAPVGELEGLGAGGRCEHRQQGDDRANVHAPQPTATL